MYIYIYVLNIYIYHNKYIVYIYIYVLLIYYLCDTAIHSILYLYVYIYIHIGGFLKWGCPLIIHFNGMFHYKPSIFGYPHSIKPPYGVSHNILTLNFKVSCSTEVMLKNPHHACQFPIKGPPSNIRSFGGFHQWGFLKIVGL